LSLSYWAQEAAQEKKEPPSYKLFRAAEDYSYLKDPATNPYEKDYMDVIKFIALNKKKTANLRLGGEIRPRVEYFNNRNWSSEDEFFYTQRISLHSKINLGKHISFFGDLYHGMVTLEHEEFAQSDQLDIHQGFMNVRTSLGGETYLKLRLGRQEMALGSARLIGLREGPNIRRSFDMAKASFAFKGLIADVFYGKEVLPRFSAFDNDFSLFQSGAPNPELWGVYSKFSLKNDPGKNELYYLGFRSESSFYNDAFGPDLRHTFGLRRFGKIKNKWIYNSEVIAQIGSTNGQEVFAWALEIDWKYQFKKEEIKPILGLKLDVVSGDKTTGDGKIGTFNPMFTNPAYFSLAGTIAPVNLIEFHPYLEVEPIERLKIYAEWAVFNRYSIQDGVYAPPRFLNRNGLLSHEPFIGNQLGIKIDYELSRHFTVDADFSYFLAGDLLEETGEGENITHMATSISYKF
jgi:hypothetical protein